MKTVITFGTFDLFHVGHLNLLRRASMLGDQLIVGISSDEFTFEKKGRYPIFDESQRADIIDALCWVDNIFIENSFREKRNQIIRHDADILVMGDDWNGAFDDLSDICKVVYLPRTIGISTTEIIQKIQDM